MFIEWMNKRLNIRLQRGKSSLTKQNSDFLFWRELTPTFPGCETEWRLAQGVLTMP